jgi:hypothetical protein
MRFFRRPIVWMITAEVVVVAALVGVAWHEFAGATGGPAAIILPSESPQADAAQPSIPADALTPPVPAANPRLPGLNVDPAFWRERLSGLNQAEAQFEALEWRIVRSAMDTVQRYVDTVVIPAIERAEKQGR